MIKLFNVLYCCPKLFKLLHIYRHIYLSSLNLGTTLNLLKFPIINPTPYRMFRRAERLKQDSLLTEDDMNPQELNRIKQFSKQGYLVGEFESLGFLGIHNISVPYGLSADIRNF